jgi:hypothetical protein
MTFGTWRLSPEPVVFVYMGSCQHITELSLVEEFRRTVSGRTEPNGKSVVCGNCGDRWSFMYRLQLPEWLRAELRRRGL